MMLRAATASRQNFLTVCCLRLQTPPVDDGDDDSFAFSAVMMNALVGLISIILTWVGLIITITITDNGNDEQHK